MDRLKLIRHHSSSLYGLQIYYLQFEGLPNKIMTLYAETRDAGFFITTEYKLLFVNKRTLQVQETTKYPFMKARTKVQTLTFLN
jgi:hypothetical protein